LRKNGGSPSFQGWRIMYPQALGRIAAGEEAFRAAIEYLNSVEIPWTKDQQACAGFILSRNDEIFDLLDRLTIERWLRAAQASLSMGLRNGFSQRQYYLPILMAGLLRWRLREPSAFIPDTDPTAISLSELVEEAIQKGDMNAKQRAAYEAVHSAIHDKGARPDLLQTLFDLL
jgi:hypothetical protein